MPCLIAAATSGSGKTLVSLGLTAWLRRHGVSVQTFKVGPDYLDAEWLGSLSGRPCRNLDPVLCSEAWLRNSFRHWGSKVRYVLVEGVMGLYDGIGPGEEGSSAHVARLLDMPVVMVLDASRQAGSAAALVRGFRDHGHPSLPIAGVILNKVGSARHAELLRQAMASIGMPVLGVLRRDDTLELPSRHLGLKPVHEQAAIQEHSTRWADLMEQAIDWRRLRPLLQAPQLSNNPADHDPLGALLRDAGLSTADAIASARDPESMTMAVASDAAFHFRYPESDELLRRLGAQPVAWRPLEDEALPAGCTAVVLPGGYPELHAARLASCAQAFTALRQAHERGMPIYGECGGLLLLGQELADTRGDGHRMAGLLPFRAGRGALSVGYRRLTPLRNGLLVREGDVLRGHELHRWQCLSSHELTPEGESAQDLGLWMCEGWGIPRSSEGWSRAGIHASWIHLHWAGCPMIPSRLYRAAKRFKAAGN